MHYFGNHGSGSLCGYLLPSVIPAHHELVCVCEACYRGMDHHLLCVRGALYFTILPLCSPYIVDHIFCEAPVLLHMFCADTSLQETLMVIGASGTLCSPSLLLHSPMYASWLL